LGASAVTQLPSAVEANQPRRHPVVNRAFRLNTWAAAHEPARIVIAANPEAIDARFGLSPAQDVALKGIAEP